MKSPVECGIVPTCSQITKQNTIRANKRGKIIFLRGLRDLKIVAVLSAFCNFTVCYTAENGLTLLVNISKYKVFASCD